MISNRLKTVASFVPVTANLLDVGCDHALLDIYLYMHNHNLIITASDNKKGPLAKAFANLKRYGLEDKIELVLGEGLEILNKQDTVIIAGMGGMNIAHIIDTDLKNINTFIICPNNDEELVRTNLLNKGFYIQKEKIVWEYYHYYIVMLYKRNPQTVNDLCLKYGYLSTDPLKKAYYQYLITKKQMIIHKLPIDDLLKKEQLKKEVEELKSLL